MKRAALAVLGLLAACPSAYERAVREDTPAAWRAALASNPDEDIAYDARRRLEELEFQAARKQHTVFGYKRFLDEFPDLAHAGEARLLLEGLRFEAARKEGTAQAWEAFLADHPDGKRSDEARLALAELSFAGAKAGGVPGLIAYAARFPASPRHAEALAAADDLSYEAAKDADGIYRYLRDFPEGRHRAEARAAERQRELQEMEAAEDLAGATGAARAWGGSEGAAAKAVAARLSARRALAALDAKGLEAAAAELPGDEAKKARNQAKELKAKPPPAELKKALAALDPAAGTRPVAELLKLLAEAPDPRSRWLAAEELGFAGGLAVVDALVDAAAESRNLKTRLAAVEAALAISRVAGPVASRRFARGRVAALSGKDASAPIRLRLALLEELRGDRTAAIAAWRQVRGEGGPADPLVLWRLAVLAASPTPGERVVDLRDLGAAAERLVTATTDGERAALIDARQLCGAAEALAWAARELDACAKDASQTLGSDALEWARRLAGVAADARAKLGDAEAALHAKEEGLLLCAEDDVRPRLDAVCAERAKALARLAAPGKVSPAVAEGIALAVARARREDPCARVP